MSNDHDREEDDTLSETALLRVATQNSIYGTLSHCESQGPRRLSKDIERNDASPGTSNDLPGNDASSHRSISSLWGTLSILLVGVFVSQLDATLVLATYGRISSEFDALDSGSWILSAYFIAQCAVQPLYGKLSDIYSRKACLIMAYVLFTLGTVGVGQARSIGEITAWRTLQGAGGAGMVSVVSIVITDLVPKNEVASLRSYVNVLQTMGRSCGGVIGGLLTQAIGWRWAFFIQAPPMILAIILVAWTLESPIKNSHESRLAKLKRVDFVGAFFLALTILAVCLVLDLGGQKLDWSSPWILGLAGGGVAAGIAFVVSAKLVQEPIFPLHLLTHRVVVSNYSVALLGLTCQVALMSTVPIYFQATSNVNPATAGLYLIPAFAGNTLGALSAGHWIKKTGRYKIVSVLGPLLSLLCMGLVLTWNGSTSPAESLYIFPGGLATGAVLSSTFVGLIAGLEEGQIAVAASGMYLAANIGSVAGVSGSSAASQAALRSYLETSLRGYEDANDIIEKAISKIGYIWQVEDAGLQKILIAAYTRGFHASNLFGIGCSIVALLFAAISPGDRLEKDE